MHSSEGRGRLGGAPDHMLKGRMHANKAWIRPGLELDAIQVFIGHGTNSITSPCRGLFRSKIHRNRVDHSSSTSAAALQRCLQPAWRLGRCCSRQSSALAPAQTLSVPLSLQTPARQGELQNLRYYLLNSLILKQQATLASLIPPIIIQIQNHLNKIIAALDQSLK